MIFPIGDTQVKGGTFPYFSYAFLIVNVVMFVWQTIAPGRLICEGAVIPQHIANHHHLYTLITSQFLHAGLLHLLGNIIFLWIFADNVEASVGNIRFLIFYLIGGIAATFAHIYFGTNFEIDGECCIPCNASFISCKKDFPTCEAFTPTLGASGALSAVIGAYIVMFPKSKIKILVLFLFRNIFIPAWVFLILWFSVQLYSGYISLTSTSIESMKGVAWWAHIGGFVYGVIMGFIFRSLYKFKVELEE